MNWFTSDLHFGHVNIIEFCKRPYYSVGEMNDDLICRWNQRVRDGDNVYILGDLCMGRLDDTLPLIECLNGTKILYPGNHDRMFHAHGDKFARWTQRYLESGIDRIYDAEAEGPLRLWLTDELSEENWVLGHHFPYKGDTQDEDRYHNERPVDEGHKLVHGHTHGLWRKKGRMVDVGVDAWGGYPVSFVDVQTLLESDAPEGLALEWK